MGAFDIPNIGAQTSLGLMQLSTPATPIQNGTFVSGGVPSFLSDIGNIGQTTALTYIHQQADKLVRIPQPSNSPVVLSPQYVAMTSPIPVTQQSSGIGGLDTQQMLLIGGAILLIVLVALKG